MRCQRKLPQTKNLKSSCQAFTAFSTACIQYSAATAGCHTCAETVSALAANDGRLVSTFHVGLAILAIKKIGITGKGLRCLRQAFHLYCPKTAAHGLLH